MQNYRTQQKLQADQNSRVELFYQIQGSDPGFLPSHSAFQFQEDFQDDFTYADVPVEETEQSTIEAEICYLNDDEVTDVVTQLAINASNAGNLPIEQELLQQVEEIQKQGSFYWKNVEGFLQPEQMEYAKAKGKLKLCFILESVLHKIGGNYITNRVTKYLKRLKEIYNEVSRSFGNHPPNLSYL